MPNNQLFDNYKTDGSANPISLKVTVGYAQSGSTGLSIDNVPLVITPPADINGNFPNSFTLQNIGSNASLKGKVLAISTAVTKAQPTASSSELIEFDGGTAHKSYGPLTGTLTNPGDIVNYYSEITFT